MSDSREKSNGVSVEAVFQEALSFEGAERVSYLARVCPDSATRARVEALLAAHGDESGFLPGGDSIDTVASEGAIAEEAGAIIGRFKLLEKLGEGGFGSVWAAEQREPVKRRVALKIIKLGMDTKQVVARFEAERQALALMDHPNIAKVLDAGATETGRPYFVMELVKGIPITKYFEQEGTEVTEKLRLFIRVCQAIQHAHQKGIIHRDIKPSNVMVTLHDGEPVPKVIDFGIAKATQGELTDKTIYTQYSQFIGTPAYMSPEQAEMSGLDVDTRSDIYSLGVLLYELLTGTTPFDGKALLASGLDEMRRIIREEEPVRPSTRVSETLTAGGDGGLRMRRQREALPQMRGDLDWIVMKCLEKDRSLRYDTANGLAMDIDRHLKDQPITARPPSALNLLGKAWRRHRTAFAGAAAVALALTVGLLLSLKETVRANREREAANVARRSAEDSQTALTAEVKRSEIARQSAEEASERAESNAREAERNLYAADMNLAFLALDENHYAKVRKLLEPYVNRKTDESSLGWEGRYLWKTIHQTHHLDALEGHSGLVSAAVFLGNNQQVVTGSDDQTIRIWDLRTKRFRELEPVQGRYIKSLVASHDGHFIAAEWGGVKNLELSSGIGVWDVRTGELLATVKAAVTGNGTRGLAFRPKSTEIVYRDNLRYMQQQEGRVIRFDWKTRESEIVADNQGELGALVLSDDGQSVLYHNSYLFPEGANHSDSENPKNSGYDLRLLGGGGDPMRFPLPVNERSNAAGISPDGSVVAIGLWYDPIVMLLDAQTGERIGELRGHNAWISCIQFSADGKTIYTSSGDHTIRVWDAATQSQRAVLRGHDDEVWDIQFSPDRKTLVSASKDSTARLWATEVVDEEEALMGFLREHKYQDALIEGSRTTLVATEQAPSQLVVFFEVSQDLQMELNSLRIPGKPVLAAGFVPGEETLFVVQSEGVSLWDWRQRVLVKKLLPFDQPFDTSRVFSRRFLGAFGGTALCANWAGGAAMKDLSYFWKDSVNEDRLTLHPVRDLAVAPFKSDFEPRSRTRAVGTVEGMISLQPTDSSSQTLEFKAHRQNLKVVAFSSDGNRLYTAGSDGYVSVWDWKKQEPIGEPMRSQLMSVDELAVSPNQKRLVTSDARGALTIWDLERRRELGTMHVGKTRRFRYLRFITNDILIGLSYHFVRGDTKWHVWSASDWETGDQVGK